MKQFVLTVAVFLVFILTAFKAQAVSVSISDFPATITDDTFILTASVSGATNGTNYLRVDLFKDGTTNYFGETFNGNDFYGGSTYTSYLPITIVNATWSGQLQARTGSPTSGQYDGSGIYKLRLRRYTGSGGYTASEANANAASIVINIPTPTPTPTDTPTPTPTSAKTPTPSPTIAIPVIIDSSSASADILGSSDSALENISPVSEKEENKTEKTAVLGENNYAKVMASIGGILMAAFGIIAFRKYKRHKNEIDNFSDK